MFVELRTGWAGLLVMGLLAGCGVDAGLPPVARTPLAYGTTALTLPGCSVQLPPVQDDLKGCSVEAIGAEVKPEDLCEVVTALKNWMATPQLPPPNMEPGDWGMVRAIAVCRMPEPKSIGESLDTPYRWSLHVYADVPERPRLLFGILSESTRRIQFGAVHRGGQRSP